MNHNIELYLISGFLGSGKTTFLKKVLNEDAGRRTGVIVNEFGRESIDGRILNDGETKLVELNNGSIFCACLKANFVKALAKFLTQPIDRLFVEASGMADPSSMERLLEELTPLLQKKNITDRSYDYMGSVCVVDAGNFLGLSEVLTPITSQVRKCSLLVLNKVDTVPEKGIALVKKRLHELNPEAHIIETTYAEVSDELLHQYLHGESALVEDTLNTETNRPFGGSLYLPAFAGDMDVEGFLQAISPKMIRMKGFFYKSSQLYHADCVGDAIKIEPVDFEVDELANEIILISKSTEDLTDYLTTKMKEFFGDDVTKFIFLPN